MSSEKILIIDDSPEILTLFSEYLMWKNAVEAIKLGAFDYLTKPVKMDEILVTLQRALEYRKLKLENMNLRNQLKKKYKFENIIGDHEKMQKVFEVVEK